MYLQKILDRFKNFIIFIAESMNTHPYKIMTIQKTEEDDYIAIVQIKNKSCIVEMKPEEILADDRLTDSFSQRDIRTLTYLGYLGINSPKYKILAKRLSENDKNMVFAIKEKGKKKLLMTTAEEISANTALLGGLDQKDAHTVGYTSGSQSTLTEKEMMERLIKEQKHLANDESRAGEEN
jgi:hypothetical protein